MAKKSNVFLNSSENIYGLAGTIACGCFSVEEINNLLKQIHESTIPDNSCLTSISASDMLHIYNSRFSSGKSNCTKTAVLCVSSEKKCGIRDQKNCTKRIASGKCCDEFVINLIGKKLFANKYQNEK